MGTVWSCWDAEEISCEMWQLWDIQHSLFPLTPADRNQTLHMRNISTVCTVTPTPCHQQLRENIEMFPRLWMVTPCALPPSLSLFLSSPSHSWPYPHMLVTVIDLLWALQACVLTDSGRGLRQCEIWLHRCRISPVSVLWMKRWSAFRLWEEA